MSDDQGQRPESMLPYEAWAEEAMRHVMLRALQYAAAKGLPGEHHFFVTFRTDHPGTVVPDRLRAQYPQEMTIVLQHQFWDLEVDEATRIATVGLSFGGVASTLRIPLDAVTQFADPHVRYGLRFEPVMPPVPAAATKPATLLSIVPQAAQDAPDHAPGDASEDATEDEAAKPAPVADQEEPAQVVSLDAFRRRPTPVRES